MSFVDFSDTFSDDDSDTYNYYSDAINDDSDSINDDFSNDEEYRPEINAYERIGHVIEDPWLRRMISCCQRDTYFAKFAINPSTLNSLLQINILGASTQRPPLGAYARKLVQLKTDMLNPLATSISFLC